MDALTALAKNLYFRNEHPDLWKKAQKLEEIKRKGQQTTVQALSLEFSEPRLLRLSRIKPTKLTDFTEALIFLYDIKRFRGHLLDSSYYKTAEHKKGWGVVPTNPPLPMYVATTSRIAKLDLLIEDLVERVSQLEAEERQSAEALKRSREAAKQFAQSGQDVELASALWHALDTTPPTAGFVYLKRWSMPDGSSWFKVGITNNPGRREAEQNVLPVAAETVVCIDVGSMDRARAVEAVIHQVLDERRITDANNLELFHLSDQQAAAVKAVLESLE